MVEVRGITVGGDEPTPPLTSYLTVAASLLSGMSAMNAADGNTHAAHAFLSCHVLECILKAYLSQTSSANLLQAHDFRHNLEKLWGLSAREGLQIPPQPPLWVQQLSFLNASPFYLRYAPGVVGVAMPNPESARSELVRLLGYVDEITSERL